MRRRVVLHQRKGNIEGGAYEKTPLRDAAMVVSLSTYELQAVLLNYFDESVKVIATLAQLDRSWHERVQEVRLTCVHLPALIGLINEDANAALTLVARHYPRIQELFVPFGVTTECLMAISAGCPSLLRLWVDADINEDFVVAIAHGCRQLELFNLYSYRTGLTDAALMALADRCTTLKCLELNGCSRLTDVAVVAVARNCSLLESLALNQGPQLTDEAFVAIGLRLAHLKTISAIGCRKITDRAIFALARGCSQLEEVRANGVGQTNEAVFALARHCPRLRLIDWRMSMSRIHPDALYAIGSGCPNFELLELQPHLLADAPRLLPLFANLTTINLQIGKQDNFDNTASFTDAIMIAVATHCPLLKSLYLSNMLEDAGPLLGAITQRLVTDAAVLAIAERCSMLQDITIDGFNLVTDASLAALSQCSQLRVLTARGCVLFTDAGLLALARGCTELRRVSLAKCELITDAAVIAISQRCRHCFFLGVHRCPLLSPTMQELTGRRREGASRKELQQIARDARLRGQQY